MPAGVTSKNSPRTTTNSASANAIRARESAFRAPENAAVLYNLGICYSELGHYDDAIIRLKRAVQRGPGHAHAWVGIGNAYYRIHKPEPALTL